MSESCINPDVEFVTCYNRVCAQSVKPCQTNCPEHGSIQLSNDEWVCSEVCLDEVGRTERIYAKEIEPTLRNEVREETIEITKAEKLMDDQTIQEPDHREVARFINPYDLPYNTKYGHGV